MSQKNLEGDKMLHLYILDYFLKRKLYGSAMAFLAEVNVQIAPHVIHAPRGFLLEWWSAFWDLVFSMVDEHRSEGAKFYYESQVSKTQEMRRQLKEELQETNEIQQLGKQFQEFIQKSDPHQKTAAQFLLQWHAQQQQCIGETQLDCGNAVYPMSNDPLMKQNRATSNVRQQQLVGGTQLDCGNAVYPISNDPLMKQNWATSNAQQQRIGGTQLDCGNAVYPIGNDPLMKQNWATSNAQQQQLVGGTQLDCGNAVYPISNDPLMKQNWATSNAQQQQLVGGTQLDCGNAVYPIGNDPLMKQSWTTSNAQQQQLVGGTQLDCDNAVYPIGNDPLMKQNWATSNAQQQQLLGGTQLDCGNAIYPISNDPSMKQNWATSSAMETKLNEDRLEFPLWEYALNDAMIQQQVQLLQQYLQNPLSSQQSVQQQEKFDPECMIIHDNASSSLKGNDQLVGSGSDPPKKVSEGLLKEIKHLKASSNKIECCHFSANGKLLATAGHDKKVSLWCTELFNLKCTLKEHSERITDVRFCPSSLYLATSSADKTVKVWDVDNPSHSLRTFKGHTKTVMSLDFHPCNEDLIFSSNSSELRYWSIKNEYFARALKGGATQLRFQSLGKLLAVAVDNFISIIDAETLDRRSALQGHKTIIRSICWAPSRNFLASLSDDLVRIWMIESDGEGKCIQELNLSGNKFYTCVFYPLNPVLVIGCNETIKLWNFKVNEMSTVPAHKNAVSSLAVSDVSRLVASTSHDRHFKIWK